MDWESFAPLLGAYFFNEPRLLFIAVGLAVAILTWRKHPRVSAIAATAFSCFVLSFLARVTAADLRLQHVGQAEPPLSWTLAKMSTGLFELIGWAIIILAVFVSRPRRSDG